MSVRCRRGQRTFSELPLCVFRNHRYAPKEWRKPPMGAETLDLENRESAIRLDLGRGITRATDLFIINNR